MKLLDRRDALTGQSIDEDQLPERSVPIKGFRQNLATEIAEVTFRTPPGKIVNTDVFGDIEFWVIKPDWRCLVEKPRLSSPSELRNEVQTALDQPPDIADAKLSGCVLQRTCLKDRH
jgi:hypothetical protein